MGLGGGWGRNGMELDEVISGVRQGELWRLCSYFVGVGRV